MNTLIQAAKKKAETKRETVIYCCCLFYGFFFFLTFLSFNKMRILDEIGGDDEEGRKSG